MKIFGKAAEFYRIRVLKLIEESRPIIKWDETILFREPPPEEARSRTLYLVQAVRIDDNQAFVLKRFKDQTRADKFRHRVEELLEELTKNQFEAKFPNQFD